jgi:AhpD family alkylhydroperoxidase
MDERGLSEQEKELVGLGASVGAGCHPCVDHHLKAAKKADLDDDRLRTAITSAQLVAAQAADDLALHVQRQLDVDDLTPAAPAAIDMELAALGAAIGANDRTNIEGHMTAAAALGVTRSQLQQAIDVANSVQTNASAIHLRAAQRMLDEVAPAQTPVPADSREESGACGCGENTDPAATGRHEPSAAR